MISLGNLGVDGKIILKYVSNNLCGKVKPGFIPLRIESSGGLC
jgi:hypothetical protein